MRETKSELNRRKFLKTGLQAAAGAAALGAGIAQAAAPKEKKIPVTGSIPTRPFGKTGHVLPIFGHGGSAMSSRFISAYGAGELISEEDRVKMVRKGYEKGIRYFDTARAYAESERIMGEALEDVRDDVYLATKTGARNADGARRDVERSLKELRTDYLDCVQVHTPGQFDYAMEVHGELMKMKEEGIIRFIGVTTHIYFENIHKMISTGGFDQVLLAYGYFRRGLSSVLGHSKIEWRNRCLAKANELEMGVVAMKILGANIMNHNAKNLVPDYDENDLKNLAAAAIRWVISDERVSVLNIGISLPSDIDENLKTVTGDLTVTTDDRRLLADYSAKAYNSETVKAMPIA